MMRMKYIGVLIFSLVTISASGQEFSVSTNIVGYLNLGTMNVEASYAPDRHWSLTASARYNPFSFSRDGQPMRHRQQSYSIGTRYWPWHIYSGWWVAAKLQYQEYSMGGVISPETEEGDGFGIGLSAGYSYMIHPRLNLEFGLGLWSGVKKFTVYDCTACGHTTASGTKGFILPNELLLSIVYVF